MSVRTPGRLRRHACAMTLLAALTAHASQPRFFDLEGPAPFLAGELDGLAVDSDGHVRLAPATREVFDTATPYVWALVADARGTLYAGTGNEGQVFRVRDGKGEPFFKADELEIHALALGPDGRLYVGSSPDGKVYVVDASEQGTTFFDPPEKYIWALAFDAEGRLLVATGGDARLHRVTRDGRGEVLFASPESHFTALALGASGRTYLGSAPGGVIYQLEAPGKAFVLADTPFGEVKALDTAPDGTLYAALFEGGAASASVAAPPTVATSTGAAQVTISETFTLPTVVVSASASTGAVSSTTAGAKGAVMRFHDGDAETLWTSSEDAPHALLARPEGVLVGTGDKGRLVDVGHDQSWALRLSFGAQQVTALARLPGGALALSTSNAGKLFQVEASPRQQGTFTSLALDAGGVSSFGRVRWDVLAADGTQVELRTRSGNTQAPDGTWSDWSAAYARADGTPAQSPKARFLQVRATLHGNAGRSPQLEGLSVAYLQRNRRPQITSLTVHPAGQIFQKPIAVTGEIEVLGLERAEGDAEEAEQTAQNTAMALNPYGRKLLRRGIQTLSWKAEDANQDTLLFDLAFRRVGESRFRPLRQGLREPVYAWDTTALPNGRYVVQVTARDSAANPPALALGSARESTPFEIDNTPPLLAATLVTGPPARVRLLARDDGSAILRAEYALDGQRWVEIYPQDGLCDALEETFEIGPALPASAGPHVLVMRVSDSLGNIASTQVELP